MRRFVIGLLVLGALVVYSVGIRHEHPKISPPAATATPVPSGKRSGRTATSVASSSQTSTGTYKDGSYTGSVADAFYGNVQVKATIQGGKITAVTFLDYPHTHSTSVYINQQAMPYLQQEAIKAQSSHVNIISGATYTSQAFIQSLHSALSQAS